MPLKIYEQLIIIACNACLFIGVLLILKGYGTELGWWNLDATSFWSRLGDWTGATLTLLGTVLIAASIYLEKYYHADWRPADWISYYILAPIVIASAIGSLVWMIHLRKVVPDIVIGYAILGIVGAILRLLPFSEGKPFDLS